LIASVQIVAGAITFDLGWKYIFYIMLPCEVVTLGFLVIFVPETASIRDAIYNSDTASAQNLETLAQLEHGKRGSAHAEQSKEETDNTTMTLMKTRSTDRRPQPPRKTFIQEMAVYTGVYSQDPLWKMVLSSIVIMANLGASWTIFVQGLVVAWYVVVSLLSSQIFSAPPYFFNAAQVGYVSTGPLIGSLLGALVGSALSDSIGKWMSRKNSGV
jgi:MFS family permease